MNKYCKNFWYILQRNPSYYSRGVSGDISKGMHGDVLYGISGGISTYNSDGIS